MLSTLTGIADWMAYQRWYANKGTQPRLRTLAEILVPSPDPAARMRVLLLLDEAADSPTVYQVPIVERDTIPRGAGPHFIGRGYGDAYLFDAPHDPIFATALLTLMRDSGRMMSLVDPSQVRASSVMTAEQSNTSIVIDFEDRAPLIAKIFRVVQPGDNPEVILQAALTEAGMPFIPAFVGGLVGDWASADGLREHGHLAVVQEFVAGARDGWSLALESATASTDFSGEARRLGASTAAMHVALAERLPVRTPSTGDTVAMVSSWHTRLATAIHSTPALAPYREAIEAVYDTAQESPWPQLQRIHGDLHLGQVLREPDLAAADGVPADATTSDDHAESSLGDWKFVDFEGEPLRSLDERNRPDSALRDIAGMLRSFDYAAGFSSAGDGTWAAACRAAYLEGYAEAMAAATRSGGSSVSGDQDSAPHRDLAAFGPLLAALELDKAVYEVTYEARNRPDWVGIPLGAVARLVSSVVPSAPVA